MEKQVSAKGFTKKTKFFLSITVFRLYLRKYYRYSKDFLQGCSHGANASLCKKSCWSAKRFVFAQGWRN